MHMTSVTKDIIAIGVYDPNLTLFEEQYPVSEGMAYNSYLIMDDRIAVMDTVDEHVTAEWLENLRCALNGRTPDYLIVQHMEPDHSANIARFLSEYPNATVVASAQAFTMMKGFFGTDYADRRIVIKENDVLPLGKHTLHFVAAPMVHWPEVMVTYDDCDKILFSADGFGKFGRNDTTENWADEARRYYIGIVGKYGAQVQALLKKAAALDIQTICPLHGPVLTQKLGDYIGLYQRWSTYTPEAEGVTVAYASVYGNTRKAALELAERLKADGVTVALHDLSRSDLTLAISNAFRYDRLVLASPTYNGDVFPPMRTFLSGLVQRGFQKRTVALIENGSWAPMAAKVMRAELEACRDLRFTETTVRIRSALNEESQAQLTNLCNELKHTIV